VGEVNFHIIPVYGGQGSGNFGHAGIPGQVGGSGGGGGDPGYSDKRYVQVTVKDAVSGKTYKVFLKDVAEKGKFLTGIEVDKTGQEVPPKGKTPEGKALDGNRLHFIDKEAITKQAEYRMNLKYGELDPKPTTQKEINFHIIPVYGGQGSGNFGHSGIPGQVGGSGAGGSADKVDLSKDRNLSDGQIRQRILDDKLTNSLYKEYGADVKTEGMSVNDRLAYMKMYAEIPPEFAFTEYSWQVAKDIPKDLSPEQIREVLKEKGLTVPITPETDSKVAYNAPMGNRTTYVEPYIKGLSESEKDAFLERYPATIREIADSGHFTPSLNPADFTTKQMEALADRFEAMSPGKTGLSYSDKFEARYRDVAMYSNNKDIALESLLAGWAVAGGGPTQALVHSLAKEAFSQNQGRMFYDPQLSSGSSIKKSYSQERLTGHLQSLYSDTQQYYSDKLGKKYDAAEVTLFRGVGGRIENYTAAAAESWSLQRGTADRFGKMMSKPADTTGGFLRTRSQPYEYTIVQTKASIKDILWTYESVKGKYGWPEEKDLKGKKEYVVLGGGVKSVQAEYGVK